MAARAPGLASPPVISFPDLNRYQATLKEQVVAAIHAMLGVSPLTALDRRVVAFMTLLYAGDFIRAASSMSPYHDTVFTEWHEGQSSVACLPELQQNIFTMFYAPILRSGKVVGLISAVEAGRVLQHQALFVRDDINPAAWVGRIAEWITRYPGLVAVVCESAGPLCRAASGYYLEVGAAFSRGELDVVGGMHTHWQTCHTAELAAALYLLEKDSTLMMADIGSDDTAALAAANARLLEAAASLSREPESPVAAEAESTTPNTEPDDESDASAGFAGLGEEFGAGRPGLGLALSPFPDPPAGQSPAYPAIFGARGSGASPVGRGGLPPGVVVDLTELDGVSSGPGTPRAADLAGGNGSPAAGDDSPGSTEADPGTPPADGPAGSHSPTAPGGRW